MNTARRSRNPRSAACPPRTSRSSPETSEAPVEIVGLPRRQPAAAGARRTQPRSGKNPLGTRGFSKDVVQRSPGLLSTAAASATRRPVRPPVAGKIPFDDSYKEQGGAALPLPAPAGAVLNAPAWVSPPPPGFGSPHASVQILDVRWEHGPPGFPADSGRPQMGDLRCGRRGSGALSRDYAAGARPSGRRSVNTGWGERISRLHF